MGVYVFVFLLEGSKGMPSDKNTIFTHLAHCRHNVWFSIYFLLVANYSSTVWVCLTKKWVLKYIHRWA